MELRFHRYHLPWPKQNSRSHTGEGLLLQYNLDGTLGYSSLHPWTTLDDLAVSEQIRLLKLGTPTSQMKIAIELAHKDATARITKSGGVKFLPEIKNHFLVLESELTLDQTKRGLPHLKITNEAQPIIIKWKISPANSLRVAKALNQINEEFPNIRWRLDSNALFGFSEIITFWRQLSSATHKQIEFIEDPCLYDRFPWNDLEANGIPLAIDFEASRWINTTPEFSPTDSGKTTLVFKPEVQDMSFWHKWLLAHPHNFVITSYLGHPVGLLHALWVAETFYINFPKLLKTCGLNLALASQHLKNIWPALSQNVSTGNNWQGIPSLGIGETAMMEELQWSSIGTP